jgi:hypothetical protein
MKITLKLPVPGPNHYLDENISVKRDDNHSLFIISKIILKQTTEPVKPGFVEFEIEVDLDIHDDTPWVINHHVLFTEEQPSLKFQQNQAAFTNYVRNTNPVFFESNSILSENDALAKLLKMGITFKTLPFTTTKLVSFSYDNPIEIPDNIDTLINNTVEKAQPQVQEVNTATQGGIFSGVIAGALTFGLFAFGAIMRVSSIEPNHHEKLDL